MTIKYSEEYLIGHETIDRQHEELFRAFNTLLEAGRIGQGKKKIEELLDFLGGYAVFHFEAEKALMIETRYPDMAAHLAEHGEFLGQLKQLKDEFALEGATMDLLVKVNESLLRWIINHIRKTDIRLARHLHSEPPAVKP